mgnify:CR=1 FL=1
MPCVQNARVMNTRSNTLNASKRTCLRLALLFFSLLGCWSWAAAGPLNLHSETTQLSLDGVAQQWLDEPGTAQVYDLARPDGPARWTPLSDQAAFRVRDGQAVWLRFEVQAGRAKKPWFLELPYAPIDELTLYTPSYAPGGQTTWAISQAGDRVAMAQRVNNFHHPLLPVVASPDENSVFFVKLKSPHPFAAKLRLVRQDELLASYTGSILMLGAYFGLLVLGIAVAGTLGYARRDRPLQVFAMNLLLMGLTAAALDGVARVYLWPAWPRWNDLAPTALGYAVFASMGLLVHSAVAGIQQIARVRRVLLAASALGGAMFFGAGSVPGHLRIELLGIYVLTMTALSLWATVRARQRGDEHAGALFLALLPVLLAVVLPMARAMGVPLPRTLVEHALLLCTVAQVPLMLLVLLRRSQQRLEQHSRLSGLDRVDAATGLALEPVFLERGARMLARCRRFGHQGLVVLVDIANADRIERDFEKHRPNELPVRVAARLVALAREVDVVARLSGRRFGMLIEGPVSETEEATMGPRVVASCLMPFADKPEGWVARVHVAYALVPLDGTDMAVLVQRLSDLLQDVPPGSAKAVFTLGSGAVLTQSA